MADIKKKVFNEGIGFLSEIVKPKPKVKGELPTTDDLAQRLEEIYPRRPERQNKPPKIEKSMSTTQAGTACAICSLDHISTCAGILEEANRFARREGIDSPEVIRRISICRQQLNSLEREDANPQKLVQLPPVERKIMEGILPKTGKIRHRLNDIVSLETLEEVTAEAQNLSDEFQNEIFQLQLKRELVRQEIEKERPDANAEEIAELSAKALEKLNQEEHHD